MKLFDGAAGGAAAGGDGAADGDAGVSAEAAAPVSKKRNPLADVKYGVQEEVPAEEEPVNDEEARAKSWQDIRNSQYKAEFDKDVQDIISKRFRNQQDLQGKLDRLAPVLQQMAKDYGVQDANDIDGIVAKYMDDDRLYEAEALEKGIPVETVKELSRMRAMQEQQQRAEAENRQRQEFDAHMSKLMQQSEIVKAKFPGFDLMTELQNNADFARLTSPSVGVDVDTAYYVCHRGEIEPQAMAVAVQQSERKLAQSQRRNAARPTEGAASGSRAAVTVKNDPRSLTKADRDEIRRRAEAGEMISF